MPKLTDRRYLLFITVALFTVFAFACGGGDDPTATTRPAATFTATSVPATPTASGLVGDAARGEELFVSETCAGCHSTGSTQIVGPGLAGLSERAASLGGDAYIEQSIRDRNAVITPGFSAGIMTDFSHLDDQTVADLVAYLKTLQ